MALVANIKDGNVVTSASQDSLSAKRNGNSSNGMDKDAFLQLLVAQMEYQDPLEPASNTDYIAQYAQFSQVESLGNMADTMELQRASSLVGQEVYIRTTSSTGESNFIQGKVDYVVIENNKPYLSINENLYSLDDLDTVVDSDYINAYNKAYDFTVELNKLPILANISIDTEGAKIDDLSERYNSMTDYEKSYVASDTVKKLNEYVERLAQLRAAKAENDEANQKAPESPENTQDGNVGEADSTQVPGEETSTGDETVVSPDGQIL